MEPDVIRMFSSSPPPMDDAPDEDDEEFGDFGTFSVVPVVPNSVSFSEFDTPTTFNQTQALNATSPPELNHSRGVEAGKANGHAGGPGRGAKDAGTLAQTLAQTHAETLAQTLTNGFQGSPTSLKSAPSSQDNDEDFADFAAFSDEAHADSDEALDKQSEEFEEHAAVKPDAADSNGTGTEFANFAAFSKDSERTSDDSQSDPARCQRDAVAAETHRSEGTPDGTRPDRDDLVAHTHRRPTPNRTDPEFADFHAFPADCTLQNHHAGSGAALPKDEDLDREKDCSSLNGNALDTSGSVCSSDFASESDEGARPAMANGAGDKDSETETETSLGRPLSTEALEEFGDMSTTGSVPSPPLQEETATPTGDEEEEFGDFAVQDFGSFEQNQTLNAQDEDEDFGEFNSPKVQADAQTELSTSISFGNFSSAAETEEEPPGAQTPPLTTEEEEPPGARTPPLTTEEEEPPCARTPPLTTEEEEPPCAQTPPLTTEEEEPPGAQTPPLATEEEEEFGDFGDFNPPKLKQTEAGFPPSESFGTFGAAEEETGWSAFDDTRASGEGEAWAAFSSEEVTQEVTHEVTEEPPVTHNATAQCRTERLEKLFHSSFPHVQSPSVDDEALTLHRLLEPDPPHSHSSVCVRVWAQLLDIHEALGLRFQWGGSSCNKALLCSLGIDTRNILFTGQKKQPVIVPMYAAGLGMLEPVKPVSAAELIASIAHSSPCAAESVQEALPPVQFDWSSSGLTNPLDGSSLLNLDFFGPVDDSESGAPSIPGVDPELFELTTAKMDSSKVTDAFEKLMSTVHTTSTSTTRRPRRDENLSEEALKVISRFPDLSFMTAKVLMFPATLTPRGAEPGAD